MSAQRSRAKTASDRDARSLLLPPDSTLATATAFLVAFGLVTVYSAGTLKGALSFDSTSHLLGKQLVAAMIGVTLMYGVSRCTLATLEKLAAGLGVLTLLLLVVVLIPGIGTKVGGARRWINLGGGLNFQPSEFARLATVLLVAKFAARHQDEIPTFRGILRALFLPGVFCALILLQPDFDTALTVLLIGSIILFVAGLPWIYVVSGALLGGAGAGALVYFASYRMERIIGFLDPWADVRGRGYQIIQCWIGMGSGGWFGRGLGQSVQKLGFLPEAHTDFIFAVVGEEWGFLGAAAIVSLFMVIAWRGYRISAEQTIPFARYLGAGITAMVTIQALLNLMVVTGLAPTTGVPLPLVSYGGTSLVFVMASLGILWGLSRRREA
jgi:cell division protein FtsW